MCIYINICIYIYAYTYVGINNMVTKIERNCNSSWNNIIWCYWRYVFDRIKLTSSIVYVCREGNYKLHSKQHLLLLY